MSVPVDADGPRSVERVRDSASVYVLDDHEAVLATLVELIDAAVGLHVIGWSTAAATAIKEVSSRSPDVAVVDADLGGEPDGLDVCRELAVVAPSVTCVIVTAGLGRRWGPTEAAEAGVAAIVLKQIVDFPLVQVIKDLAYGS